MNNHSQTLLNLGRSLLLGATLAAGLFSTALAADVNPSTIHTVATPKYRDPNTQRNFWHYRVKTTLTGNAKVSVVIYKVSGVGYSTEKLSDGSYRNTDVKALPDSTLTTEVYYNNKVIARKTQKFPNP